MLCAQFHRESAYQMRRQHYAIYQSTILFAINGHLLKQRLCRYNLTHQAAKGGFEMLGVMCPAITVRSFPKTACRSSATECFSATAPRFVPSIVILMDLHASQSGADGDYQYFPIVVKSQLLAHRGSSISSTQSIKLQLHGAFRPSKMPDQARFFKG